MGYGWGRSGRDTINSKSKTRCSRGAANQGRGEEKNLTGLGKESYEKNVVDSRGNHAAHVVLVP